MPWVFLVIASLFEVGWVYSLKATAGFTKVIPIILYACCGLGAAFFLSQALKEINVGTAYAVWVGMAVAGSNIIAVYFLGEPFRPSRMIFVLLIIIGVAGLKATENSGF